MRLPFSFTHFLKTPHNMDIRVKLGCNSQGVQFIGCSLWSGGETLDPTPFISCSFNTSKAWGVPKISPLPFTSVQNSLYTFLSEKPPIFWVVFHLVFWCAGHSSCGRNFYYTTPPNICQEKRSKKLFYLFFPKLLTFGRVYAILIMSRGETQ